jgi:hypothetical protein
MVRIAISQAAFDATAESLPFGSVAVEPERAPNGDVYVWLPRDVLARLRAMRGPGESYSDAILALAKPKRAGDFRFVRGGNN